MVQEHQADYPSQWAAIKSIAGKIGCVPQTLHPLLRAGFQVTATDNLAHGQSTGDIADVRLWGQGLLAASQALDPIHAVIRHSAGSAASLYAFAHGLQVDASVHIAGPPSLKRMATGFALAHGLPHDEIAAFRAGLEAQLGVPMAEMDLPALQDGLRHPALILHDPQDKEVPFTESLALHEAWSLSQLVSVEGVGHRRILRAPEVIAMVIAA
ncbi:MAG: alpha/beta hydrolase [Aquabacterium sp.]|jgi:pimeloyl-ACP methyl ester carboxylesterase